MKTDTPHPPPTVRVANNLLLRARPTYTRGVSCIYFYSAFTRYWRGGSNVAWVKEQAADLNCPIHVHSFTDLTNGQSN